MKVLKYKYLLEAIQKHSMDQVRPDGRGLGEDGLGEDDLGEDGLGEDDLGEDGLGDDGLGEVWERTI